MLSVCVKELRETLSTVLRRVQAEEIVQVVRHGKGIAEIRPIEDSEERNALVHLRNIGILGGGAGQIGEVKSVRNRKPDKLISDLVLEGRR